VRRPADRRRRQPQTLKGASGQPARRP